MTLHKSLKIKNTMKRQRSVLTRAERIAVLEDEGRWLDGESVFGLPKVRQYVMKRHHAKAAEKEEETAEGAEAVEGTESPQAS